MRAEHRMLKRAADCRLMAQRLYKPSYTGREGDYGPLLRPVHRRAPAAVHADTPTPLPSSWPAFHRSNGSMGWCNPNYSEFDSCCSAKDAHRGIHVYVALSDMPRWADCGSPIIQFLLVQVELSVNPLYTRKAPYTPGGRNCHRRQRVCQGDDRGDGRHHRPPCPCKV